MFVWILTTALAGPPSTLFIDTDAPMVRFTLNGRSLDWREDGTISHDTKPGTYDLAVFRAFGKVITSTKVTLQPGKITTCTFTKATEALSCT
jgi:hypothetical protein